MKRKHYAIPYSVFLAVFVIIPIFIVLYYAFTNAEGHISFENIAKIFEKNSPALVTLWDSVKLCVITTLICLILGYPLAYFMSNKKYINSPIIVLLFLLPMWINFLLRTIAMKSILDMLGSTNDYFNTVVGMVYDFLPFMVLPIYTMLVKMDKSLIEASVDLGCRPFQTMYKVVIPLSLPGVISGSIMVFMPALSSYAVSDILGGGKLTLFGNIIDREFMLNSGSGGYNYGSALSLILLMVIGVSLIFNKDKGKGGEAL
jgi:spermidine/putrescine transport system permease protein